MKRMIKSSSTYRDETYYKDYTIRRESDGFYYIYDLWDKEVPEYGGPYEWISDAEYYIDQYIDR